MLDLVSATALLRVLSDPTRVRLLALLRREELTVAELSSVLRLAQPRVSTHLAKLKETGLVRDRRAGVSAYYRFNESGFDGARQGGKEVSEQLRIRFQVRRQLKKDRAQFAGMRQRFDGREKARDEIGGVLKALYVRDHLMRFDSKPEVLRGFGDPFLRGGFFQQLAEGQIHFDGVELTGVVGEKPGLRQFGGIEIRLPAWVGPPGRAHKKLRHDLARSTRPSPSAEADDGIIPFGDAGELGDGVLLVWESSSAWLVSVVQPRPLRSKSLLSCRPPLPVISAASVST